MMIRPVQPEDEILLKGWSQNDPIEMLTCRPISPEGKRIGEAPPPVRYVFQSAADGPPIGRFTWFDHNRRNRSAEFGFVIAPDFRHQGWGTKMLITALNHLFNTTDLNKLYCQTGEFNHASVWLVKGLGFHLDGILREHHDWKGRRWDDLIFSLLRNEWEQAPWKAEGNPENL